MAFHFIIMKWKAITIYQNTFVSESVAETDVQVNRIHSESNRIEIFLKDIIQSQVRSA